MEKETKRCFESSKKDIYLVDYRNLATFLWALGASRWSYYEAVEVLRTKRE